MKHKIVLIVAAFVLCMAVVIFIREGLQGTIKLHHHEFYELKEDWQDYTLTNLEPLKDKNYLVNTTSGQLAELESIVYPTLFEFDEIVLSWNMMIESGGGVMVSLSVSPDNIAWYDFYYQVWGDIELDTLDLPELPEKIQGVGYLDEDIIRLRQPMNYYKYTMYMFPGQPDGYLMFRRAVVCYTKTEASVREYKKFTPEFPEIQPVVLSVPFKSQKWLPDSIAGRCCSPTSVTMVLNHHFLDYTHLDVAERFYDRINDIYGNWLYNVQGAYMLGLEKTWVGRHNSFNELMPEISIGKPVVISIAVEDDQVLSGAPYRNTNGHLIVVRGFDEDGNVLVNDPAAADSRDGIVTYDIDELTDVWVGHEGVAYHLWPSE